MKLIIFTLCLSAFYLQGTSGGIVTDVETSIEEIKLNFEKELNELIEPIVNGAKQIEERYVAYKIRQSEIETFSLWNLNYSACMEFGSTVENSSSLAWNISTTAYQIVMNVSDSFNALSSNCTSWNPYEAIKCYITNIAVIKDEMESIKPLIKFYEETVLQLAKKVEDQFFTCIGDEPQPSPTDAPTAKPTEPTPTKPSDVTTPKPSDVTTPKPADVTTPKPSAVTTKKSDGTTSQQPKTTAAPVATTKKPWWHFW